MLVLGLEDEGFRSSGWCFLAGALRAVDAGSFAGMRGIDGFTHRSLALRCDTLDLA